LDTEGAKRALLSIATGLPLYGSAVFAVQQEDTPNNVWFALSVKGLSVLAAETGEVLKSWTYREVANWGATKTAFHIVAGNLVKPEKRSFASPQSPHISALFAQYTTISRSLEK